jgi:hypothetical protein
MIERGVIHNVDTSTLGSYLAADAASSATSITVDLAVDFNEDGGSLSLNTVTYTYTSADADTGAISGLSPGLTGAALEGDRVDVLPLAVVKTAAVMAEHAEDALTVRVPHSLMPLVPDGIRVEGEREVIQFDRLADEFVITDLVGKEPVIDGNTIDPSTLPPPASDGNPPASSPALTATGNIGAIHYRWTPVANADPYQFNLHVATATGFTPGPGNLVTTTAGSSFTYIPAPLDYTATYFAVLIEFDEDGEASPSAEVSAQLRKAVDDDISANYAYLGTVTVDQLTAGTLSADVALASTISTRGGGTGAGLDIKDTLARYDSAGTPTAILGDTNTFKGEIEASGLTVTGGMSLRSGMNEVSRGASLTAQQATTAPQSAPSVIVGWPDPVVVDSFSGNYGLVWTGSEWATLSVLAGGGTQVVERSSSGNVTLDSFTTQYAWGGFTLIGSNWYTLEYNSTFSDWWVTKYNSGGTALAEDEYTPLAGNFGSGGNHSLGLAPAAIGTDGTNILVAEFDDANNRYRIQTRSTTTLAVTSTMNTGANAGFTGPVVGVKRGNFDFGSERTVILTKNGPHFYTFDNTSAYVPNDTWAVPSAGSMSGFDYDATRFWSTRAKYIASNPWIYKHTTHKWTGADPLTWHGTSTWRDTDATGGTHESDMAPVVSFSMKKRAAVTLTSPTIPDQGGTDDPNAVSFYLSNTTTARTSMWRQTLPSDGINTVTVGDGITFSGTNPPASNNFPTATSGVLKSSATAGDSLPEWRLEGDGNGRLRQVMHGMFVRKSADQTVTNSATLVSDSHLLFPVIANGIYMVSLYLILQAGTNNNDIKVGWQIPSGTFSMIRVGASLASTTGTEPAEWGAVLNGASDSVAPFGIFGNSTPFGARLDALLSINSTGGTATMRWACNSTGVAANTIVKGGSWMKAERVG